MRRQNDPAGEFFRKVADQGPRKGADGATRQGRYAFTTSGVLLGYNNNRGPERMLIMLNGALEKMATLPSAVEPHDPSITHSDERYHRAPPEGGAVIKVFTRVLEESSSDPTGFQRCSAEGEESDNFRQRGFGAAIDHLWIQREEIDALAQLTSSGATFTLPGPLMARIVRFHLTDNTRGEPPHWAKNEIHRSNWKCTPDTNKNTTAITGDIHLETADGERGFEGTALGNFSIEEGKLTRFDLIVLGDFWGDGRYTKGARRGKNPIGISLTLPSTLTAADKIPPQGARWLEGYYKAIN